MKSNAATSNVVEISKATASNVAKTIDAMLQDENSTQRDGHSASEMRQTLTITKSTLVDLFDQGILPPAAYVVLALMLEQQNETTSDLFTNFDFDNFVFRWRGYVNEKEQVKELKKGVVAATLFKLEEKEKVRLNKVQVQLSLDF